MRIKIHITGKTPYLGMTDYSFVVENVTMKSSIKLNLCSKTILTEDDIKSLLGKFGVDLKRMTPTQWYDHDYWENVVLGFHRTFSKTEKRNDNLVK